MLVHDFGGYAFPAELSRALARRGHRVVHAHCGGVVSGKGAVTRRPGDPPGLSFVDVHPERFERYSPAARLVGEVRYGARLAKLVRSLRPDVVLSANTPVVSQAMLWAASRSVGALKLYWLQDFLGRGVRSVLTDRNRWLGATAGCAFEGLETLVLRASDGVVVITEDFVDDLRSRSVSSPVAVIENWAPVSELDVLPKDTEWSRSLGLARQQVALYAGTLGLKHDPAHLVAVARALQGTNDLLVVVTEGLGREVLEQVREDEGLTQLRLLDLVPYEMMGHLLGSADVGLVLLEPAAGTFSVPSKVLTYLASGRAIVGAIPSENLAARTIERSGAGVVVPPGDHAAFATAVTDVLGDDRVRAAMGARARTYALETFDADRVGDRFIEFFGLVAGRSPRA